MNAGEELVDMNKDGPPFPLLSCGLSVTVKENPARNKQIKRNG